MFGCVMRPLKNTMTLGRRYPQPATLLEKESAVVTPAAPTPGDCSAGPVHPTAVAHERAVTNVAATRARRLHHMSIGRDRRPPGSARRATPPPGGDRSLVMRFVQLPSTLDAS